MIWTDGDGNLLGSRFYLSYSGSAPTAGNCATLASDVSSAWGTNLKGDCQDDVSLTEVDVLDIATDSGLSGQWTGTVTGTNGSTLTPINCAINVEYGISRRYRGGKPRCFLPPAGNSELDGANRWSSGFLATVTSDIEAFFTAVQALSIGSMGTLVHVSLSYYKGFTNITNSSGRERAVPTYRGTALLDTVTGYFPKAVIGSQRRRRTSTSP
jgi:hypothetical protein